ncbi:MAG: response regulator [Bacteroidaceae bacterium]|nr:response regulator [Bacteroidaceae bacterium]
MWLLPLLLFSLVGRADTLSEVDSLLNIYAEARGAERLSAGKQLLDIYTETAVFFGEPPTIGEEMPREEADMNVWFGTERFFVTVSYFTKALDFIEHAMPIAKDNNTDIHATLLCDQSYCLYKTSDYTHAIETAEEAVRLSKRTNNTMQLSRAYLYIALVNYSLRNYDEAVRWVEKSVEENARMDVNVQTHNVLGVACELYTGARQTERAIECGLQAVKAAEAIDYQPGVANHLTQLAYAYDRAGEYQHGLEVAQRAIEIVKGIEPLDRNQLAISLEFLAWNLLDLGRYAESADALREAIDFEQQVGNTSAVRYDYRTLAEALEPIDPHEALNAMKQYVHLNDSIHTAELKALTTKANAELDNDELREENAQERRQNAIILATSLLVGAMLVLAILSLLFAFRQKKRSAEMLQRLTKAREEFFTNVTHEFRTPLTIILGVGHDLQKETPLEGEHLQQAGRLVERQGQRLLALVNQLLDISRVQSAVGNAEWTFGDMTAYTAMVVESFDEMAHQKGISMNFTSEPSKIETDFVPDYLYKMLGNLLGNALKFTPEGGSINLSLRQEGRRILIDVADSGRGIEANHLAHIFEPFYRIDGADGKGTGVGLTLVQQIVAKLGGKIDVESTPGAGTTFHVSLPQRKQQKGAISSTKIALPADAYPMEMTTTVEEVSVEGAEESDEEKRPVVLIVEDNADVASYIGQQIAGEYALHYAADGEQGIAQARALVPDLIITDLMMPHTDGMELLHTLRTDDVTNHIPIIVVTARATDAARMQVIEAGADAYLTKPFSADELRLRVEKLLEMRRLLQRRYAATITLPEKETPAEQPAPEAEATPHFDTMSEAFMKRMEETTKQFIRQGKGNVEQIASELCMSPSQLRRKLKAVMGIAPKEYVLRLQLEMARDMLLRHPERTTADVAERCGFYDLAHFTHAFRKMYDTTPAKIRKTRS